MQSATLINSLIEIMKRILENGEDILITGFGKFWVKEKGCVCYPRGLGVMAKRLSSNAGAVGEM
jgi:hypothetical protein